MANYSFRVSFDATLWGGQNDNKILEKFEDCIYATNIEEVENMVYESCRQEYDGEIPHGDLCITYTDVNIEEVEEKDWTDEHDDLIDEWRDELDIED